MSDVPKPRAPGAEWPVIDNLAALRTVADDWFSNPTELTWEEIRFIMAGIRRVTSSVDRGRRR